MKRIVVVGSQASGKSYLSKRLGKKLDVPVFHLDELFWTWRDEALTPEERKNRVIGLARQDEWIIDGNFLKSLDTRVKAADTAIQLDLPRWLCLWRLLKRRSTHVTIPRSQLAPFERNTWPMLKAIWTFPKKMKPRLEEILQQSDAETVILKSHVDVIRFLASVDIPK